MCNSGWVIWVIFRRILALAFIMFICFGIMPYAFKSGIAAGAAGLLAGALVFIKIKNVVAAPAVALLLFAGAVLCKVSEIAIPGIFLSICFAFSGGVMLYIACGELLPD